MTDITPEFDVVARPVYGIVVYQKLVHEKEAPGQSRIDYVEYFDVATNGQPINAHPLRADESERLANALLTTRRERQTYLKPAGVIPAHVLQIDASKDGYAMWYTPARRRTLLHDEQMGLPSGEAAVPALLWKATTQRLMLFALNGDERPTADTPLFAAPFGNTANGGSVCMGSVPVSFEASVSLDSFMARWEAFFFNSYFTHLNNQKPVKSNFVQLWTRLLQTREPFPGDELIATRQTLSSL